MKYAKIKLIIWETNNKYYQDGIELPYSGFRIIVPKEYSEYLTSVYGDYMKFAPEEYREKMMSDKYYAEQI